jgi:hypothetical protein
MQFFCESLEYLGFVISKWGLETSQNKVKAILKAPEPKDVISANQNRQVSNYGGVKTGRLFLNQPVLAKDFRGRDKWTEATVIAQLGPVTYIVELENGVKWKRRIDQLIALQSKIGNSVIPEALVEFPKHDLEIQVPDIHVASPQRTPNIRDMNAKSPITIYKLC